MLGHLLLGVLGKRPGPVRSPRSSVSTMKPDEPAPRHAVHLPTRELVSSGLEAPPHGVQGLLIVLAGVPLVLMISLLDHWSKHQLSLALLYPVPVALAAWRGGFPCGVLVALTATVSWQAADLYSGAEWSPIICLWNGIVRFGVFTMTSSLLARLRLSLLHEKALARTDSLTGAANGRTFYETVCLEVERSLRTSGPLTLAYLDLDNFKQLNDHYGHAAGDRALRQISQTIRENVRSGDLLARLGGDELALLLPDTDANQAQAILNRVRGLVARIMEAEGWPVTLSIGAATFPQPPRDVDLLVRHTDSLMYRAKHGGKNRIEHEVVAESSTSEDGSRVERRAAARILCSLRARVRAEGGSEPTDELACVRDISITGVSLHLQRDLPLGTLLAIEPLYACGAVALVSRVMWVVPEGDGWLHGCQLPTPLSDEELRRWVESAPEVREPVSPANGEPRKEPASAGW